MNRPSEDLDDKLPILRTSRLFDADAQCVFDAWTQPNHLSEWFGPPGCTVESTTVDLRVGGLYNITIQTPGDERIYHYGEYREIDRPRRLSFTWVLSGQPCGGHTGDDIVSLVSINFDEIDDKTEVILIHEQLPSTEAIESHRFGWEACFDSLTTWLE